MWNPDGTKRLKNVATSDRGEFWRILLPGARNRNTYQIQAKLDDCGQFGSGRIYESPKYNASLSDKKSLVVKNLKLKQVGFCSGNQLGGLYDFSNDV